MQRWSRLDHWREDLVQETMLSLCKSLQKDGFKLRNQNLKGLTQQIAMRSCQNYWKKLEREQGMLEIIVLEYSQPADHQPTDRIDAKRLHSLLRRAIFKLDLKQQRVIRLHRFEGRTYRQMAAELHHPIGTVQTRFRSSMKALSQKLEVVLEDRGISWLEAREIAYSAA
jgi:RNA polymerase sigma factor (sigma-70 family)